MLEAYAFLAMFTVQILATSILYPTLLVRYWRSHAASIPPERLAQLFPGVDLNLAQERCLARYRMLNMGIMVLGLLLLGWLFSYLQRPDWDDGPVEALVSAYFLVQMVLPFAPIVWLGLRFNLTDRRALLEPKRTAVLERRGLFDFVSPFEVFLAVLSYLLFAAYLIYIQRDPFPGFAGLFSFGGITLVYVINALVVYAVLYGKKANPYETHARRVRTMGLTVKSCVYSCIACVVFLSLNFTLVLLDWQRWEPFALSAFFVICALLSLMALTASRQSRADDLGSSAIP